MATQYDVKILSYDANGKKTATKTFSKLASGVTANSNAKAIQLAGRYMVLTNADSTEGKLVTTADLDLEG